MTTGFSSHLLFELRLGDEVGGIIRAACVTDNRDQFVVVVFELIRRRLALQADQVFGLGHDEKRISELMINGRCLYYRDALDRRRDVARVVGAPGLAPAVPLDGYDIALLTKPRGRTVGTGVVNHDDFEIKITALIEYAV